MNGEQPGRYPMGPHIPLRVLKGLFVFPKQGKDYFSYWLLLK